MKLLAAFAVCVLTFTVPAEAATGGLPLRRGAYVEVTSECVGATASARSWFGGGYVIQAPHAQCKLKAVTRSSRSAFVVTRRCNEYGDPTKPFVVVDHIKIVSRTEFEMTNRFGRFRSRWCRG